MSSENFVAILENKDGTYLVEEIGCDGKKIEDIGAFTNLRQAMIAAENHQIENEVEYGIKFYPFPRTS